MPFDTTTSFVPEHLDFEVEFEETKFKDKKYVINTNTGEYLGIVGKDFTCANHGDFFRNVVDTATQELQEGDLHDAEFNFRTARGGAWAMLDITLPSMKTVIETDRHETEVKNRIISLHGIDGSCSNQVFFGAIDGFCLNGCIYGEHDKIRRKNTSNFSLDNFIKELSNLRSDFYQQTFRMKAWAKTSLKHVDVEALLASIISSERKAKKMYELYRSETYTRGENKWALYSALTNYASYADKRNGFSLRNTGNDTQATSMWSREQEVSKWVSDNRFLEAA
jgi:hypothetical protein